MVRSGMDAASSWNMIKDSYVNGRFKIVLVEILMLIGVQRELGLEQ